MSKKTSHDEITAKELYARIERRNLILNQIQEAKEDLHVLSDEASAVGIQASQASHEVGGLEKDIEFNQGSRYDISALAARLEEMKSRRDELRQAHQAAQEHKEQCMAFINHLERVELPECMKDTTVGEVLAHQDAIAAVQAEIENLTQVIRDQQHMIEQAQAGLVEPQDRAQERSELLAEIAMGAKRQGDLEQLDQLVAQEHQAAEKAKAEIEPTINQAQQTITGLNIKVNDAHQRLGNLRAKTPEVLHQYLRTEAERVAAEYVEHAEVVRTDFLTLFGIDQLLYRIQGRSPNIIRDRDLNIPSVNLQACKEHINLNWPARIMMVNSNHLEQAGHLEKERLRALGITLV